MATLEPTAARAAGFLVAHSFQLTKGSHLSCPISYGEGERRVGFYLACLLRMWPLLSAFTRPGQERPQVPHQCCWEGASGGNIEVLESDWDNSVQGLCKWTLTVRRCLNNSSLGFYLLEITANPMNFRIKWECKGKHQWQTCLKESRYFRLPSLYSNRNQRLLSSNPARSNVNMCFFFLLILFIF